MGFALKTEIQAFDTFADFVSNKSIGASDFILTSKFLTTVTTHWDNVPNAPQMLLIEDFGSGEPKDTMVDAILDRVRDTDFQRVIAIGGGTVIDVAKLLIFDKSLTCEEIFAQGAQLQKQRPLYVLPTTCGTGSEVTGVSICEFTKKSTKLGLAVPALFPNEAILIPQLLESLPYDPFITSAIDAMVHAMESFMSPNATTFSKMFSREALLMVLQGFVKIEHAHDSRQALLSEFLTASCYAGVAFSNAGCATVHAMAYPLGATYHIAHGKSNYYLLLEVFEKYRELGVDLSTMEAIMADGLGVSESKVWKRLEELLGNLLPCKRLAEFDITYDIISGFATSVIENQQRLLKNSPIPLTENEIVQIYAKCL